MLKKIIISIILILVAFSSLMAQNIMGRVEDEKSKEPIPSAYIRINGMHNKVTITDMVGNFKLLASTKDTLYISSVGYILKKVPVTDFVNNKLVINMKEDVISLDEITVKPKVPRAKVLFNEIIKRKKENRQKMAEMRSYKALETITVYSAVDSTSRITRAFHDLDEVTVKMDNYSLRFSRYFFQKKQ